MTANLSRAQTRRRSAQLRLDSYRVEVDVSESVDPATKTFPTVTALRCTSTHPQVDLDFLGSGIDSVAVDGQAREVTYDGAQVHIADVPTDQLVTINVRGQARYSRTGEGMHRYVDPVDGRTYLYTHYEPADARRVFVNLEQPDLKAPFTFVVTGPADWEIASNARAAATRPAPDNGAGQPCHTVEFAPTPPMSTYLTCIAAGPYRRWDREWTRILPDGSTLRVPLGMLCRDSLAEAFDPDALFTVTEQGLDFFHDAFDYPYPWGKYDSIFLPEYNIGAMENPGLVTFADATYVFTSPATRSQREGRANTVLHEMAHMWFGDLVTPAWWDDLWLKESFADYMGTLANAVATEYEDAWTPFSARRKAWAYRQDQLPTTHPIVADIPDVEAAKQNFDGITYAKGASVLKQLVAYVGQEAFFEGSRRYFRRHAFAATTLPDLLTALEEASGRDLGTWADLWLETTGVATLTAAPAYADGRIAQLEVRQDGRDPVSGHDIQPPHRLAVGLYSLIEGRLQRTDRFELDVTGPVTGVEAAVGRSRPDLIVVNDDDLTYAKVRLDDESHAAASQYLTSIESSLTRACLWSSLWNACRDALLSAADYVDIVLRHAPQEQHVALHAGILANAGDAIELYAPQAERPALRRRLLDAAFAHLGDEPGTDRQLTWLRALARSAGVCADLADEVRALLDGSAQVEGLQLGADVRWAMWTALAATGHADVADLDAERASDATSLAPIRHLEAVSARPDTVTKAQVWRSILDDSDASNDEVDARIDGFAHPGHSALLAPYADPYFAALTHVWSSRSQTIAERIVVGTYPAHLDLGAADVDDNPVLHASREWLEQHPQAPTALRRLVIEQADYAARALRAQAAARP